MKSLLEMKTPLRSLARSYILTTPESSNIGILEVLPAPVWAYLSCHIPWLAVLFSGWLGLAEEVQYWKNTNRSQSNHPEYVQPGMMSRKSTIENNRHRFYLFPCPVFCSVVWRYHLYVKQINSIAVLRVFSAWCSVAGDATREPKPVPGSVCGLGDLRPGGGTLPPRKSGRPAGWRQREAGLDV